MPFSTTAGKTQAMGGTMLSKFGRTQSSESFEGRPARGGANEAASLQKMIDEKQNQ